MQSMAEHQQWMTLALRCAEQAQDDGEVPVGAVVVKDGQVIGEGRNSPIARCDPTAHAEVQAIRAAALHCGNYRLVDARLYVTLEPCTMCAGAIIHARLREVVFGAYDARTGAAGSVFTLLGDPRYNHRPSVLGGVLEQECATLLKTFFSQRR